MENKVTVNVVHVNPKVAEAYAFLGQALGISFNIQAPEAPVQEVKEEAASVE
jgi:hypothetical protein